MNEKKEEKIFITQSQLQEIKDSLERKQNLINELADKLKEEKEWRKEWRKEENYRIGELIKKPKLDLSVGEYKYFIDLINEINGCYLNSLFTALALISRKAIIVISHALSKKDNKESLNFKDNGAFDKYISWLYDNHYLTNQQKSYLTKLKKDSNALHHTYDMETEKKDGEKYFKIIKGLIESNFETENFNFKSDLISEDFNLNFELDLDKNKN